jgi:hypothetical protein
VSPRYPTPSICAPSNTGTRRSTPFCPDYSHCTIAAKAEAQPQHAQD